jgi:methylthioribose-1-phosphate isomerase
MNETSARRIQPPATVVAWCGDDATGFLRLLDQTRLPCETAYLDCHDTHGVWDAIRRLVVRGAPAIGVAAGYGVVVASQALKAEGFGDKLTAAGEILKSSRPTAVNLAWAVDRVIASARGLESDPPAAREAMLAEARRLHEEDVQLCANIGECAAGLMEEAGWESLLTHCNAGALATAGIGTATAGMYVAAARGRRLRVYCDETRPLLQGARLTAWELQQAGIEAVVIADNMAAQVLREGRVDAVITGADRIAANGDAANKIGTYGLAIAAKHHDVPFYVAAPYSTFDLSLAEGGQIPIEQRDGEEITRGFGRRTAPEGIATYNPAFDVTPAELIAGLITDRGLICPVNAETVGRVLGGS